MEIDFVAGNEKVTIRLISRHAVVVESFMIQRLRAEKEWRRRLNI